MVDSPAYLYSSFPSSMKSTPAQYWCQFGSTVVTLFSKDISLPLFQMRPSPLLRYVSPPCPFLRLLVAHSCLHLPKLKLRHCVICRQGEQPSCRQSSCPLPPAQYLHRSAQLPEPEYITNTRLDPTFYRTTNWIFGENNKRSIDHRGMPIFFSKELIAKGEGREYWAGIIAGNVYAICSDNKNTKLETTCSVEVQKLFTTTGKWWTLLQSYLYSLTNYPFLRLWSRAKTNPNFIESKS